MTALREAAFSARLPDKVETKNAKQLQDIIAAQMRNDDSVRLSLANEEGGTETVTLAPALAKAFLELLQLISSGHGFQMIPLGTYLTTQQAADLLNVSRPYLLELLEEGKMPYKKIGRHRRVPAEDLFAYRERMRAEQKRLLKKILQFDQENNLL